MQETTRPKQWSFIWNIKRVIVIEIVGFAVYAIVSNLVHLKFWYMIGIYLACAFLIWYLNCVTYRLHTVPGWIWLWLNFLRRDKSFGKHNHPFRLPNFVGEYQNMGTISEGDYFISIIELFTPARDPIYVKQGIAHYPDNGVLRLDPLIDALHQYDVNLDSIDVINIGSRITAESTYTSIYENILSNTPTASTRRTLVVLRLKPSLLLKSINLRGGGELGMNKTLSIITKRTLRLIKEEGIHANILNRKEINDLFPILSDKLIPPASTTLEEYVTNEKWTHLEVGKEYTVATYAIDPNSWTVENQNEWWKYDTFETTITMRITPMNSFGNAGANMRGWIRYVTSNISRTEIIESSGILLLHGRQALCARMPLIHLSPRKFLATKTTKILPGDNRFHIPIGSTGQLIGNTKTGEQVYLDISAKEGTALAPRYAVNNVDHTFVAQLILRALATGAKIKIHSPNWSFWRNLIEMTGSNNIWIEGDNDRDDATIALYDRSIARGEISGRTIISLDIDDRFPKNVLISLNATSWSEPNLIEMDLGEDTLGDEGIIELKWELNRAEEQYFYDMANINLSYGSF